MRHVPARVLVGIAQAEIGAEIDHAHAAFEERRDPQRRGAERQRSERDVGLAGDQGGIEGVEAEVELAAHRRQHVRERLSGALLGGDDGQTRAGVPCEVTNELGAGVSGGADDGDPDGFRRGHGTSASSIAGAYGPYDGRTSCARPRAGRG